MRGRDEAYYLRLMHTYATTLDGLVSSGEVTRERLGTSELVQAGVVKYLELIGEQAYHLVRLGFDPEGEVELEAIANMRHRMVHAYEGINWNVVETATFEDVPELVGSLERLAGRLGIELGESTPEGQ